MLANLNDVLMKAKEERYGVGLFNTVSLEMAKGVLAAAEETRSPVIIGTAEVLLPYAALEELAYFLLPMAEKATVPVVVHFDHGLTEEKVQEALELGFTSVMYDCSTESYEENIRRVSRMVKKAHGYRATVEAELGHVGANTGDTEDDSIYTQPKQAKYFVEQTGADALAVAIGTAHGAYKAVPKLDIERLKEIREAVPVPLVLHGGSGLTDEDFKNCVKNGISKINIFTDINCASAKAVAENYKPGLGMTDLMLENIRAIQKETEKKMKAFGCAGKA
ncbi:MAG: class II fructose-bisphosphate aldolase [Blautia sp.]|jgi:fructose-bisphosphate aldolase class II